jgi:aryl-alcohol dehydrogenase-like predicted oxidoreductase
MKPGEIMRALNAVVKAGKARFVGCCNYPAWLLAHSNGIAVENGWPTLVCNQVPYNLVERGIEIEVLPQAAAEEVAITAYRPLLAGVLAGRYALDEPLPEDARGAGDERVPRWLDRFRGGLEALFHLAQEKGATPARVAIAWLRACPALTCPIVGVSKVSQFEDSVKGFALDLSPQERDALAAAFGAEVKEEAGGGYPPLRRELELVGR